GDRFDRTAVLPLIALGHVPLLVFFGLTSNYILVTSGILLGMVHFSFQPIGNSLIAQFTSSSSRGMGYGISFFLSFGIGSLAAGAGGTLAVRYGVSTVFPAVAMFMVVAFFVSLYLRRVS
ncbi:MAG: hypothetical protein ACE5GH_06000, partial [Fidelibacterota bacterium]